MSPPNANEGPSDRRIIVDEDWKSQVEQERAQQRSAPLGADENAARIVDAAGQAVTSEATSEHSAARIPPPSISMLISTLATQAMMCLGQVVEPGRETNPVVELPLAQHYIDTLAMLEEKTRGNLTGDEQRMLGNVLHELRMIFVYTQKQQGLP